SGHINTLPKAVSPKEHGVHVVLELFEHEGAGCAGALDKTGDADLVEEWLHQLPDFLHQLEVGEEDKSLAVGQLDEVLDPVDQRVTIAFGTWIGHFADHVKFHLSVVIEWSAHLQQRGGLGADTSDEVVQA